MSRTPVEHHPKCERASYAVGLDMGRCGKCRMEAALEIVRGRYDRAGVPLPELKEDCCIQTKEGSPA